MYSFPSIPSSTNPPFQQIHFNEPIKIPVTKAGTEKSNRIYIPIHITLTVPYLLGNKVRKLQNKEALEERMKKRYRSQIMGRGKSQ